MVAKTFVLAEDSSDPTKYFVILSDYSYWSEREKELRDWCEKYLSEGTKAFKGSIVFLENDREYTLFELRWG